MLHRKIATRLVNGFILVVVMAIVIWVFATVCREHSDAVAVLQSGNLHWPWLIASQLLVIVAFYLSLLRWHLLMRTIHIPIRLWHTVRFGFVGQVTSFISVGSAGGDLVKAVLVAIDHPNRRAEAVGTIVMDRVCGLFGLLCVASAAMASTDLVHSHEALRLMARATYAMCAAGMLGVAILLGMRDRRTFSRWRRHAESWRYVGPSLRRLFDAFALFRNRKGRLAAIGGISLIIHVMIAVGVYCAAVGIYPDPPSLGDHLVISPIASVAGALPVTPGGLGTFELAMTYLYDLVSDETARGRGIVVAFCYRIATLIIAAMGLIIYWLDRAHRKSLRAALDRQPSPDSAASS